jgi:hypothetical protein
MGKLTRQQKINIVGGFMMLFCCLAVIAVFTGDATLVAAGSFITTIISALLTFNFFQKQAAKKEANKGGNK